MRIFPAIIFCAVLAAPAQADLYGSNAAIVGGTINASSSVGASSTPVDGVTLCGGQFPYGANSHVSRTCGQTTAAVTTSPVTIFTAPADGADLEVCGLFGAVKFCDKIQANLNHGGVVYTDTGTGSPDTRTYAFSGSGVVTLTMGANTYSINTFGTVAGTR